MRIAVLDIIALPSQKWMELPLKFCLTKQYASVMPQAISCWCRELGHETFYQTYYGVGRLDRKLPRDLDVLFISCHSQVSSLAYALAKLYRARGTLLVIGGPHAKAFPQDCQRFFDLVVTECDKQLIKGILDGEFDRGEVVSSQKPLEDFPSVEQRWPEIRKSTLIAGRRRWFLSTIPLIASLGCPYTCGFCIDWNNPYREIPQDRLIKDLAFIAKHHRGGMMAFHDPNFGVRFDQMMDVRETVPKDKRPPYIMESSWSILKPSRLERLRKTNCVYVAPGIESWTECSQKTGAGTRTGSEKMVQVAEHFRQLHDHVPGLQGNLIFGLDCDEGNDPIELTKEFMDRTPFVWPTFNIPVPFGGTPLFDELHSEGRVLEQMPFTFYYAPYLVIKIKHYDPVDYYGHLADLFEHCSSRRMMKMRYQSSQQWKIKLVHWVRSLDARNQVQVYRRIQNRLRSDRQFYDFHTGRSTTLPGYYSRKFSRMLGPLAELLTDSDRTPVFAGSN